MKDKEPFDVKGLGKVDLNNDDNMEENYNHQPMRFN